MDVEEVPSDGRARHAGGEVEIHAGERSQAQRGAEEEKGIHR